MKRTVWKYKLGWDDHNFLEIPKPATPIAFKTQCGVPMLWCLVDPNADTVKKHFRLMGTGHLMEYEGELKHIDSILSRDGFMAFHLFEVHEPHDDFIVYVNK